MPRFNPVRGLRPPEPAPQPTTPVAPAKPLSSLVTPTATRPSTLNPQPSTTPVTARIAFNAARQGIEIHFAAKPDAAALDPLKEAGWRWSFKSRCWYHRDTPEHRAWADQYLRDLGAAPANLNSPPSTPAAPIVRIPQSPITNPQSEIAPPAIPTGYDATTGIYTLLTITGEPVRFMRGQFGPMILTGRRTRWDNLYATVDGEHHACLQGLHRGRYGDAKIQRTELRQVLATIQPEKLAEFEYIWRDCETLPAPVALPEAPIVRIPPSAIGNRQSAITDVEVLPPDAPLPPRSITPRPSLLEYARGQLSPDVAARVTTEAQVESFRAQYERDFPSAPRPLNPQRLALPPAPDVTFTPMVQPDQLVTVPGELTAAPDWQRVLNPYL